MPGHLHASATHTCKHKSCMAAIAQQGERQTEDLKAPGSIPGLGILQAVQHGAWPSQAAASMLGCVLRSGVRPVNVCMCVLLFTMLRSHAPRRALVYTHARAGEDCQTRLAF